jgi:FkbM family methyltransferase
MKGKWLLDLAVGVVRGQFALAEAISFVRARAAKKPVNFSFGGVAFVEADHILWSLVAEIFVSREYTPKGFEISENDLVVDVGAHKGVFLAYAAQSTANRIIAIEPDPGNVNYLKSLSKRQGWDQVEVIQAAVSGKKRAAVKIYTAGSSSRNSILAKDVVSGEVLSEFFETPALTLQNVLGDVNKVDFLKMDCEGAEFEIVRNTSSSSLSKIDKLVLEFHSPYPSESMDLLVSKLKTVFPYLVVVPRHNEALGYIYARTNPSTSRSPRLPIIRVDPTNENKNQ